MEYTTQKNKGTADITITLPWSEVEAPFNKALDEAVAYTQENTSIKGFRKGHIPKDVAAEQVNRAQVLSSVVDEEVQKAFAKAVKEEELKAVGTPRVNIKKIAEGNDVEVEIGVDLVPEVELPKKWEDVIAGINKDAAGDAVAVEDADVDQEIERLAESRTETKAVERAAADGDQTVIDFKVRRDGDIIEGGESTDHNLVLGKGAFIPGFEENVIGMTAGETKTFELAFPEKYHAEDLAGQKASFEVTLKSVEERITPNVDDAFAKTVNEKFETVADLKVHIKEGMEKEKAQQADEKKKTSYLEGLSEKVEVDIADGLKQDELGRMMAEMEQQISQSGMTLDDYLAQSGQSREKLMEMWAPQAEKRIISALLLEVLGEHFKVDPEAKEVEEEMNRTLAMYGGAEALKDRIDMQQMYNYTKGVLRNNLVFEKLSEM